MEKVIDIRTFTVRKLARSIIISRSNNKPKFYNVPKFKNSPWPTPALLTYETVVSIPFAKHYWKQNSANRKTLLHAVTREFDHESRSRIYRRIEGNDFLIEQLTATEFEEVVLVRLHNHQYKDPKPNDRPFDFDYSSFHINERIMVDSPSKTVIYDGNFQFLSCINTDYCFVQFYSRPNHLIRWKKEYVRRIEMNGSRPRRQVRQTQFYINESSNNSLLETNTSDNSQRNTDVTANGNDYEELMEISGFGNENMPCLDESWLHEQGYIQNPEKDHPCVICWEPIELHENVYHIKCDGKFQHIFHSHCIYKHVVKSKKTNCPLCRDDWISNDPE